MEIKNLKINHGKKRYKSEKEEIENEENKENNDKKKKMKKKSEVFIGNSEENIIREKRDKKEKIKWYKNLPNVDLIKTFNHFYRS